MSPLWLLALGAARADCPVERTYEEDCRCYCDAPVFIPIPSDLPDTGLAVYVFPPPDTVVPTNVLFRTRGIDSYDWFLNGERFPKHWESSTSGVTDGMSFVRPEADLEPGDQIELWTSPLPEANVFTEILVGSWTVGEGPDVALPRWGGKYQVETFDTHEDECGLHNHSHYIRFEDAGDDWPGGHLFVYADDLGEYDWDQLGDASGFDVRWDGCVIDDLTLPESFHKEYRVTLEDMAGNRAGPFDVRTGRNGLGCGGPTQEEYDAVVPTLDVVEVSKCSTAPVGLPWAILPLVLLVRRRRRGREPAEA